MTRTPDIAIIYTGKHRCKALNETAHFLETLRFKKDMEMIVHYAHFQNPDIIHPCGDREYRIKYQIILMIIKNVESGYGSLIDMHAHLRQ